MNFFGINVFGFSGTFMFTGNTVWGNTTADYQNDGSHAGGTTYLEPYRTLRAGTTSGGVEEDGGLARQRPAEVGQLPDAVRKVVEHRVPVDVLEDPDLVGDPADPLDRVTLG